MNWFKSAKESLARWKAQETESRATYTPRALRAIEFAVEEARRLKHNFIGTEHLLLGLIKLDNGVAANILKHLGLSFQPVQLEIEKCVGFGSEKNWLPRIPYTPRAKRILECAKRHADKLGHTYVGTEHLLLGLLEEREGVAAHIFKKFNLNAENTSHEVLKLIAPS